ncbi:orotate phosphoribosyltransferase [Ignicoccus pacificus DSM 13166]|uniref:Orotate phosphoribosyltransferase n=1 Tax=Ignicoccus pacificus DSM 13166 TaxID=940294 RepID=A0A977PKR9_9CREN|nr:orotate phosphoribosyltransferase [Ignicoccus pacificus DSM 13166]
MEAYNIAVLSELPWTGSLLDAEALVEAVNEPMLVFNLGCCYFKNYLARKLREYGLVKKGTFILSSGKRSNIYVDMRKLWSFPKLARIAALLMAAEIKKHVSYASLAGVATGGIPLAAHLSVTLGWPMGYVRPKRKEYGQKKLVEGIEPGQKVVVIDDVTTTGNSLLKSIDALEDAGAQVILAAALLDREEGAETDIRNRGIKFVRVLTLTDVLEKRR